MKQMKNKQLSDRDLRNLVASSVFDLLANDEWRAKNTKKIEKIVHLSVAYALKYQAYDRNRKK